MTGRESHDTIMEIDLLAYADGFLDGDPVRKQAVEAFLRDHPAEAERVDAYIQQNREIQRIYGPVIAEPLPDRLMDVLHRQRSYGGGQWLRTVASIAVLAAAAAGGWLIGFEQRQAPSPSQAFVEQALTIHPQAQQAERPVRIDLASAGTLDRIPEAATLESDPPDLSTLGYTLRDRRLVDGGGDGKQMVQMTYVRSDGRRLSLFLAVRPQAGRKVTFSGRGDIAVAHWMDGPMIYGVVAKGSEAELEAVAKTIQGAARRARLRAAAAHITLQGGPNVAPPDDAAPGEELSPSRLVTPEPATAAPRERIGPIRAAQ